MNRRSIGMFAGVLLALTLCVLRVAHAHEVYVLNASEINFALHAPSPDFMAVVKSHLPQFLRWGILTIAIIVGVFFLSIIRPIERALDPLLARLKPIAPIIAQVTLGISFLASGYYHAVFGVELPMRAIFGNYTHSFVIVLMAIGVMLLTGIWPRIAGFLALGIFTILTIRYGIYMLNYATYLGEALTVVLFGGAYHLFESRRLGAWLGRIEQHITPQLHYYKFLIIRVLFGISLIYASLYAKFFHGALALDVVSKYHLTNYFHFDPIFLVLGSMMIEVLLGAFFLFGFEIRFASLFFLVFLTMSLLFFGEVVWPHLILIGSAIAMFAHGYDQYSLSTRIKRRSPLEPVL